MAMMVVLVRAAPGAGVIDPAAATELSGLGVTSVTVVGDEEGLAVVVEGWAFDAHAGDQAAEIVAGDRARARILRPILHTRVSAEQHSAPLAALTSTSRRTKEEGE